MRKLLTLVAVSLLITAIGCNKEEAPVEQPAAGNTAPVEGKDGSAANAAGQISPGPGIGQADTRAGSAAGGGK